MVEPERPQMTSEYGAHELHAGYARLNARTRMHTLTRSGARKHARKQARRRACAYIHIHTNM